MKISVLWTWFYMKVTIMLMVMILPGKSQQKRLNPFVCWCKQCAHHGSSAVTGIVFSSIFPFPILQSPNTWCAETCGSEHAKGEEQPQTSLRRLCLHWIPSNGRGIEESKSACVLCFLFCKCHISQLCICRKLSWSQWTSFWLSSLKNHSLLFD